MIYLSPEVASGLGEDTFWTWFNREFVNSTFGNITKRNKADVELRYSTLGGTRFGSNTIGLLWELYPEMKTQLHSNQWDNIIDRIYHCARTCNYLVVSSRLMVDYYKDFGHVDILPIGVDTELFKPLGYKKELRLKYGLPQNAKVGFWAGTTHKMKGFDKLLRWKKDNPDIYWIIVWKQADEAGYLPGALNKTKISQVELNELMNCADFFLSCGYLRPFFMVEWECMACNLKPVILDNIKKDFIPSLNPRDDLFRLGWDRPSAKILWEGYINNVIGNNK